MRIKEPQLERALEAPADTRFFLFFGPDEAGARALARRAGGDSERIDLSGSELKRDPARLADEAAAISLFGGARHIVVDISGDEALAAIEALMEAPVAGNPVVLLAGNLGKGSRLLKLADAAPDAIVVQCCPLDGSNADRLVIELAKAEGLDVRSDVARRIADAAAGNRAIIAAELAKLALFLDAAPGRTKAVDHDALDEVGAAGEGDLDRLIDSVLGGDPVTLRAEIGRLAEQGVVGITLARAVMRRTLLLARLRAAVEGGKSAAAAVEALGRAIFYKQKNAIALQLGRWRPDAIAKAIERLTAAQRLTMAPDGPGTSAIDDELFAICRQAARAKS